MSATVSSKLLAWYDAHARELPWRAPPGAPPPDPYAVWLSEIMLQQTTVAAVRPFFARFRERWPDVASLAAAQEADVMAAWAGLGYYSRARNLLKTARIVADREGFPDTEEELRRLPGLGSYTAAAIAAIAFDRQAVVVDANVERVVARLFAVREPLPPARKAIRAHAAEITPQQRAGDFAQAMMDLGATICTPREPDCGRCPLSMDCQALSKGLAAAIPAKAPKPVKPLRRGTAYLIERDGGIWLVRRPADGLLGGMRALPDDGWSAKSDGSAEHPQGPAWQSRGRVRHVFSHFAIELEVLRARAHDAYVPGEGEWWPIDRLDEAGLPTVFARAARLGVDLR